MRAGPEPTYVFLAGIGNSGPEHWQAMWHARLPSSVWVEHRSWDHPERDAWVEELDEALAAVGGPKLLIAHSLGCTLMMEWAAEHEDDEIVGAFLVAMPDPRGPAFPETAVGFGDRLTVRLPFRAVAVASEDDPYGSFRHSAEVAEHLGARLVNVGPLGHINAESGLGDWPGGWAILREEFDG